MPGPLVQRGEQVTLRTVEEQDVSFLQRAYTNPEIRYPLGTPLKTQGELETGNGEDGTDRFLVCLDEEDADPGQPSLDDTRPIGAVSVEDAAWRRPELVYWLVPEVHGEGYGTAAVSLVVDYVFRTYDHPAVGAGAYAFNEASRGLLESLGFGEEGRTRRDRFVDGEYVDTVQYSLLREEWRERTES